MAYIRLEALVKELEENPFTMSMCMTVDECKGMNRARSLIAEVVKDIPAEDVQPVVHGMWIRLDMHRGMEQYKCSSCDTECYVPECMGEPMYCFCPHCGARMED